MENEQLIKETFLEAAQYIGKVMGAIDQISDNFLAGRENLALKNFAELVDGMEWLINVVNLTKDSQAELAITFEDYDTFVNMMREVVTAFENNDYVLIGDLLTFEIKPILEKWQTELQLLTERLSLS